MTDRTRLPDSSRKTSAGSTHRLGDGWHHLPVFAVTADGLHQLTSEPCVLLHLACWAHRRDFDPESIQDRAEPDGGMLRADHLLAYRFWTRIPDRIETTELIEDLEQINHHRLAAVVRDIEAGRWKPDRAFTHWVVAPGDRIAGEARDLDPPVEPDSQGQHFCYVRLYAMPEMAEWGYSDHASLRPKTEFDLSAGEPSTAAVCPQAPEGGQP
jgi:hypothetical protein